MCSSNGLDQTEMISNIVEIKCKRFRRICRAVGATQSLKEHTEVMLIVQYS